MQAGVGATWALGTLSQSGLLANLGVDSGGGAGGKVVDLFYCNFSVETDHRLSE